MAETRTSRRFSWNRVDPVVTRAMLKCQYALEGRHEELPKIRGLSSAGLVTNAERAFGRPPRAATFEQPLMADTVRRVWLPRAEALLVEELTTQVQAGLAGANRTVELRTKAERIDFLLRRNLTRNFMVNLRKKFLEAHKSSHQIPVRSVGVLGDPAGPVMLEGKGLPPINHPYPHQIEAWDELDSFMDGELMGGHVVLPTGAGKTDTLAVWLLRRLADEPDLRVLWIAHQQELVDQALARFAALAGSMPEGFVRTARRVHAAGSATSTLARPDLDVAAITVQSLTRARDLHSHPLTRFLERPTIVIVDEAHHGGARAYSDLLWHLSHDEASQAVIGLTATPYPTSPGANAEFHLLFPKPIIRVEATKLVEDRILARPVIHTVDTGLSVFLSAQERAKAIAGDLAPETLASLDDDERNDLLVRTWTSHQEEWGKTLVFATRIHNADRLAELFVEDGAAARALHSQIGEDRGSVLDWFRGYKGPAVLVSVGMLTEGVDLPDARTAFLGRPTTSRILMQQMVGRVLRGPAAGGEADANIVFFRDQFRNFGEILEPGEVITVPARTGQGSAAEPELPPILLDEDEQEIPADVAAQVAREIENTRHHVDLEDDDLTNDRAIDPLVLTTSLHGYYQLPDRTIPVLEHQAEQFEQLLADSLEGGLQGTPFISYFEELPPPQPSVRALRELVDYTREFEEPPPFITLRARLGPATAADQILAAGPITEPQRAEIVARVYKTTIAGSAYRTLSHFEEAVEIELRERRNNQRPFNPESAGAASSTGSRKLPAFDRDLQPAVSLAIARARHLLPAEHVGRLDDPPPVSWTTHPVRSTFAHWSIKLSGRGSGRQRIKVNRILRTTRSAVSDDMLAYLIYHELLHHLLPGQGHDAEFREFEARWPDSALLDAEFDTLHERWDLHPAKYR